MVRAAESRSLWAQGLIARSPEPPPYGSPEWLALPESHPAKIAAVVIAAESWARDGDDLDALLELANKREDDAEFVSRAAYWQERWSPQGMTAQVFGYAKDDWLDAQIGAEWADWVGGDAA